MNLPERILDPAERIAEILFGLIMALTCTGAIGVATADQFEIRTMLIGALGCNVAWGIDRRRDVPDGPPRRTGE